MKYINWQELPVIIHLIQKLKAIYFTKHRISLWDFLEILYSELTNDTLVERAKSMAYSFMMSIFPTIIFLFTLIPYIPIVGIQAFILATLKDILPLSIYQFTFTTINDIINIPHGNLLSLGFVLALYSASTGIMAMADAFNNCYSVKDKRKYWKKFLTSLMISILLAIIIVVASGISIGVSVWIHYFQTLSTHADLLIHFIKIILVFNVIYFGISIIYYFTPALHERFAFFSYGSFIATVLIIVFSYGFAVYVDNFGSYNKVYGSIGALIGLMLWLYFISIVLLIGFEINASIDMNRIKKKLTEIEKEKSN